MLKSCSWCGRIHARDFDCGKKPKRSKYDRDERERGRYTFAFAEKSREIKERSHFLCAYCLSRGAICSERLETHHIIKLRDAPELLLEDENLICLCERCHEKAERGEIGAQILRELVKKRDESPPGGGGALIL